jgi:hypothetical protein
MSEYFIREGIKLGVLGTLAVSLLAFYCYRNLTVLSDSNWKCAQLSQPEEGNLKDIKCLSYQRK